MRCPICRSKGECEATCGMTPEEVQEQAQEKIDSQALAIKVLRKVVEMVEDHRKMPHQHSDLQTRLYCLTERAREALLVVDDLLEG